MASVLGKRERTSDSTQGALTQTFRLPLRSFHANSRQTSPPLHLSSEGLVFPLSTTKTPTPIPYTMDGKMMIRATWTWMDMSRPFVKKAWRWVAEELCCLPGRPMGRRGSTRRSQVCCVHGGISSQSNLYNRR